jgi:alpha-tubulin suppressor-like RCC1 family protein
MVRLYTGAVLDDIVAIASQGNAEHTCAVRATGAVVCWGSNDHLECGADAPVGVAPRAVPIPGITTAMQVAVGRDHACAVLTSGAVRCWGDNSNGQLVSGSTTPAQSGTPLVVVERDGAGTRAIADAIGISAGDGFTCLLHAGGAQVSCAGRNGSGFGWAGQLGRTPITAGVYPVAEPVDLPGGLVIAAIVSGAATTADSYTCARPMTGSPLCWGINADGAMGPDLAVPTPRALDPLLFADPSDVFVGQGTICVEYVNASFGPRIACLGANGSGQLGIDSTAAPSFPTDVITTDAAGATGNLTGVQQMVGGSQFTCALLTSGAVTCWGLGSNGVFGDGTATTRRTVRLDAPVPRIP